MSSGQAPLKKRIEVPVAAVASGSDATVPVACAPFDGTVTKVAYIPGSTITGANTDTRKVSVLNKGQAGAGTTEVAALQFNSGVNATAFDEKAVTLSTTDANLVVSKDDVLAFKSLHVGTGMADPGGLVVLEIDRE